MPAIAIIGRPNVGKSTLFNRLTRSQQALVADFAGTTRDRIYGTVSWEQRKAIVIDTAGIGEQGSELSPLMSRQAELAMQEAQVLLFVVDGRAGLTATDEQLAQQLRRLGKPLILVINKTEHLAGEITAADFYRLGFTDNCLISAAHGTGIEQLLNMLTVYVPVIPEAEASQGIKIAVVGRPNVGKSTLINRLLGEERVVVYDAPGTTRDSIYIPFTRAEKNYVLIDTAGVRRRRSIQENIEKFSVIKTLQAIEEAQVVIMVMNARENISEQDLHLLGFIVNAGKALVMVVNKWDGLTVEQREAVKKEMDRRLDFVRFARNYFISALHGTGVGKIFEFAAEAYQAAMREIPTAELTRALEKAVATHQPPAPQGREIKLRYAHAGGHNPPIVVIHGKRVHHLPASYQRYLMNFFRDYFNLRGTPIRIIVKED